MSEATLKVFFAGTDNKVGGYFAGNKQDIAHDFANKYAEEFQKSAPFSIFLDGLTEDNNYQYNEKIFNQLKVILLNQLNKLKKDDPKNQSNYDIRNPLPNDLDGFKYIVSQLLLNPPPDQSMPSLINLMAKGLNKQQLENIKENFKEKKFLFPHSLHAIPVSREQVVEILNDAKVSSQNSRVGFI